MPSLKTIRGKAPFYQIKGAKQSVVSLSHRLLLYFRVTFDKRGGLRLLRVVLLASPSSTKKINTQFVFFSVCLSLPLKHKFFVSFAHQPTTLFFGGNCTMWGYWGGHKRFLFAATHMRIAERDSATLQCRPPLFGCTVEFVLESDRGR